MQKNMESVSSILRRKTYCFENLTTIVHILFICSLSDYVFTLVACFKCWCVFFNIPSIVCKAQQFFNWTVFMSEYNYNWNNFLGSSFAYKRNCSSMIVYNCLITLCFYFLWNASLWLMMFWCNFTIGVYTHTHKHIHIPTSYHISKIIFPLEEDKT